MQIGLALVASPLSVSLLIVGSFAVFRSFATGLEQLEG